MNSDSHVIQIERLILAAIFQEFADGPLDEPSRQRLASYHWQEPDHQAIFSALVRFPASHPSITAAELPARLTRLGFPDVECDFLKQPHGLSRNDAAKLIQQLLADNG